VIAHAFHKKRKHDRIASEYIVANRGSCLLLTQASGELGPLPFVDPGLVANWGLPFVDPGHCENKTGLDEFRVEVQIIPRNNPALRQLLKIEQRLSR